MFLRNARQRTPLFDVVGTQVMAPPHHQCGWAALMMPAIPALSLLVAGFLMQSLWDVTSAQEGRLPGWFGKLRAILTSLAVTALILMLGRLLLIA